MLQIPSILESPLNYLFGALGSLLAERATGMAYTACKTSLCGRDGRTICGLLRQPKSTYVTVAHKRKQKFFSILDVRS